MSLINSRLMIVTRDARYVNVTVTAMENLTRSSPPGEKQSYWQSSATRRELVLLKITVLILAWFLSVQRAERIIVVPDIGPGMSAFT